MFSALTPDQINQYQTLNYFDVNSPSRQDRLYRIRCGSTYNVLLVESGTPTMRLCAIPCLGMPMDYVLLSQLLMIRTNELLFLQIANRDSVER